MKILQIVPNLSKGGAERIVLDICRELTRLGIEVQLVTFHKKNEYDFLTSSISYNVIPSTVIPSITGKMNVNIVELQKFIDDFQPDIIHSHLFESEMVLSQINYPKAKYFVHFHDNMKQLKKFNRKTLTAKENIANYFERKIILKSYRSKQPKIIAISRDTEQFIKKNLPKSLHSFLQHNAIDTKRFNSIAFSEKTDRIVMIGSLQERKGQELAIEIIEKLHQIGLKVYLDILGDGPDRNRLQAMINKLNLQKYIVLHGNVSYPESYIKNSFLFLHTAKYEPFGLVLIEAMAAGLPVVTTDGKGNRELIINGENGFMNYSRNANEIASLIENIISDEQLRRKLSINGKNFSKQFDIKDYVNKLMQLYQLK